MLRRVNFYSLCFAFGLSVLLILAGSRYANNTYYRPSMASRRNVRNLLKVEDGEENFVPSIPTSSYDGILNSEKLLEQTRYKIRYDLFKYNYSYSGVHGLEDLLIESGGRPMRNIIISTWRSGTTFLGEVLNAIPGTFYHFEPLLKHGIVQIRGPPDANEAFNTIRNMLRCNFYGMDKYFEYGKNHLYQFSHNTRLWDHCKHEKELCFDADFTSKICKLFPFQSMKVVRLRLSLIKELLDDKELNVKVIFLIRDPRGVMQSRQRCGFCRPSPDCRQPDLLCADMISDYLAAGQLLPQYPDRLMVLRYEELALNPNATSHRILKFLKLSATDSVDEFLESHTNVDVAGIISTYRVSRDVPFRWKNTLDFNYVDEIQLKCKEAMDLWGYRLAYNASHMNSKYFNPIDNYTITQ